jgi:predicted enzyme related to lactoylglutathione lyase
MPALSLAFEASECENKQRTKEVVMATYEIDYFELPVASPKTSSAFFAKAFGFGAQAFGEGYIEVRDGGVLGGLNGSSESQAPLIGIRTDDIAAAEKAITAAGGTITKSMYDYPGGKRFFFREPGGSELLVYMPTE